MVTRNQRLGMAHDGRWGWAERHTNHGASLLHAPSSGCGLIASYRTALGTPDSASTC